MRLEITVRPSPSERRCLSPRGELGDRGAEERASAVELVEGEGEREVRRQVCGEARESLV